MATSSGPPAAGAATQDDSGPNTPNAAPSAGDAAPTQGSEHPTEKKPEDHILTHDDHNGVNPLDFQGSVSSNNELPSSETLRKIEDYVVLDRDGKSRPFKSLYTGKHVARRVLIIFVRHFFCGVWSTPRAPYTLSLFSTDKTRPTPQNCQEYLRTLSSAITPESLLRLPISTFVAVVGCGDPALIDMYAEATGCAFPIYADPTRRLYTELGMVRTLALGERPAYMRKSLLRSSLESIVQGLRQIPRGLATKAGDQKQIGGEFLFEPEGMATPMASPPWGEAGKALGEGGVSDAAAAADDCEPRRVTWCHRMKTTRDHAEIPELMEVLGLDPADAAGAHRTEDGKDGKDGGKRGSQASEMRKGIGLSMAGQMNAMETQAAVTAPAPLGGQS